MTPESTAFLQKANLALTKARDVLAINYPDEAGRHAYSAAYHAAQALIFERTGKASKTHKGVKALFGKLAKAEPAMLPACPRSLHEPTR